MVAHYSQIVVLQADFHVVQLFRGIPPGIRHKGMPDVVRGDQGSPVGGAREDLQLVQPLSERRQQQQR